MILDINPDCYTNSTNAVYSKSIGDLYARGYIHTAKVVIEIDSVGSPSTLIEPPNSEQEMYVGGNSKRSVYVTQRPRLVDETFLKYASSGLQGSFMFQLAGYVKRGVIRVLDRDTNTERTAEQIINYADTGSWV